ncbi:MAP7 domain-containing protein 1-like [Chenopodium quinoa]|uniref:MAP7 domain-containing protein 1-like n=1 Tax=Chenopodium quinoa TaxID=63459 RepID=UPI000B780A2D|nr:MAP7 domain-containing protein 1-like [Chenopodium quinoa]
MARIRGTAMDPNYRGGDLNELSPENQGPYGAVREPSGGTPATPSDSILGSYNEETSPAQEAEQPEAAIKGPNSPSGSDDGRVKSKEAKKMLPTAKTPAKKASDIRKENLEKKLAAQAAKKDGGVIPRSLQKQIRQRPSVEEPALKVQKTASTTRATTGGKSIKTPGGSNTEMASKEVTPIRTATGPSSAGRQKASQKGTNPFNLTLLDLPMRALLRVEGLKKAYIRKQEEADQVKSLQQALKESKLKIDNLQAALDNAEDELKKHEEPLKRLDQAEKSSKRRQLENDRLVKEAAGAQRNFQATLEADQSRLIEENEQDCKNRMKRAFSIIHPGTDYNVWELAHKYADLSILAEEEGKPGPKPYEQWVEAEFKRMQEEAAGHEEAVEDEVAPGSVPNTDPTHPEGSQAQGDRVIVQLE